MAEPVAVYCTKDPVKSRILIKTTDTTLDTDLDTAIAEASRILDIFLKPYTTVPLSGAAITDQIAIIAADFSASIFKRRYIPSEQQVRGNLGPDMLNDQDGSGWFAVGLRRIQDYIKSYYTLGTSITSVVNPELYSDLMKKGVITPKEARDLMIDDSLAIKKKLEEIVNRTITNNQTDNLTKVSNVTDNLTKQEHSLKDHAEKNKVTNQKVDLVTETKLVTERKYVTAKQNSFAIVTADPTTEGYKVAS